MITEVGLEGNRAVPVLDPNLKHELLKRSKPFRIRSSIYGSNSFKSSCLRLGSRTGTALLPSKPTSVIIFEISIYFYLMSFLKKLFGGSQGKDMRSVILVHLDADLRKSIEVRDQTVKEY